MIFDKIFGTVDFMLLELHLPPVRYFKTEEWQKSVFKND